MTSLIRRAGEYARRFRRVEREISIRREFETLSRNSIRAFQLARFNDLWLFAARTVPYYRELAGRLNLPERFRSLEEISGRVPVLEKSAVQSDPARFLSERRESGFWDVTGGSTGTPMRCYRGRGAHLENLWDRDYALGTWGLGVWDRSALIDGHRFELERSWRSRRSRMRSFVEDRLRRRRRLCAYFLDETRLSSFYERMRRAKTKFLYSYTTAAVRMAEAVADRPPIETLRLAVTFAEPLPAHQRETIERVFRVPVGTEYSTIELGYVAGTHGDRRARIAERGVLFETQPIPDGRFEVILTDLRNPSFPLIRYRLQDVLSAPPEFGHAGCAVIGPVEGRTLDVLRTRSGRIFHGTAIIVILKQYAFVKLFQAVQESPDEVTVIIQADIGEAEAKIRELVRRLEAAFDGELAVRIKPVARIEPTAAGKHRLIVNRLPVSPGEPFPVPRKRAEPPVSRPSSPGDR